MPRPVYVLLAQGVCQDRDSNLITIFTIIEQIGLVVPAPGEQLNRPLLPGEHPINLTDHRGVAVWMKSDGDDGDFEHEFTMVADGAETGILQRVPFTFAPGTFLARFMILLRGIPVPAESGLIYLRSKVRGAGNTEWMIQDYPVRVGVTRLPPAAEVAAVIHDQ
jgi:hypothetical protein